MAAPVNDGEDAPGPTAAQASANPFDLGPAEARSVLVLHGLTGTPWEVLPVGRRLAQDGYHAVGPRLAGHTSFEALFSSRWMDWAKSSERALDPLVTEGPVAVVGFSMGALLALRLALERPHQVAALVLMGTPLQLSAAQRLGIGALGFLARLPIIDGLTRRIVKPSKTDCSIPEVAARYPGLAAFPRPSLFELLRLQDEVRPRLGEIRCPVFLVHGTNDHSAMVRNVEEVARRLETHTERLLLLNSYHQIAWDRDAERCVQAVSEFLRRHYPPNSTTP